MEAALIGDRFFQLPGWRHRHLVFSGVGVAIGVHDHEYEHWMVVLKGGVAIVDSEGRRQPVTAADAPILFKAGEMHGFDSTESGTEILTSVDMSQVTYDTEQDQ